MELLRSRFRLNSEYTGLLILGAFLIGFVVKVLIDPKSFSDNTTSFNGLLFYSFAAFIISIPFTSTKHFSPIAFVLLTPILMMYLGLGHQLHYFLISENTLVVKNHFWFWKKHIYNLEEIREVVFEKPGRWSKSVRIITHDFSEKLYPAGSLRSMNWKELKLKFGELNIAVRNETIV